MVYFRSKLPIKSNKYHAKKITIGDTTYDSKKEFKRAEYLEWLQKIKQISNLQKQVKFVLQEPYVNNKGEKIRAITYIADFVYTQDGKTIAEDTKGFRTEVFNIKKKLFEKKYPDIDFRVF